METPSLCVTHTCQYVNLNVLVKPNGLATLRRDAECCVVLNLFIVHGMFWFPVFVVLVCLSLCCQLKQEIVLLVVCTLGKTFGMMFIQE